MTGRATRSLNLAILPVFLFVCIEAAVSILARLPYQFTGPGNPDQILRDFIYSGTLLSPPLPLLLLFGATSFLVRRPGRLGYIASLAIVPVLGVMAIGSLGEALAPSSSDVPHGIQIGGGVLGAVLFASLLGLACGALRERRTTMPVDSQESKA